MLSKDEIIHMAMEASPDMTWYAATEDPAQVATEELEFLERFAALVAAHEREACAKVCEDIQEVWLGEPVPKRPGYECAAAIRSRSNAS